MTTVTVAAVQAEPVWFDAEATTRKTVEMMAEAAKQGVELIAFPELWIPGFPIFLPTHPLTAQGELRARYYSASITADGPEIGQLRSAAREHGISTVVGYSERAAGTLYMSQVIIDKDGSIALNRRKLKPTGVERSLFGESDGSGIKVVETAVARVGALNCFEHLQPLTKFAMYGQNEQIHVAAWPCVGLGMGDDPSMSTTTLKAVSQLYALEGAMFVLSSSQTISEEGSAAIQRELGVPSGPIGGGGGMAAVFAPSSAELTTPLADGEEGFVVAEIDLGEIGLARNTVDPTGHNARPDVLQLRFDARPRPSVDVVEMTDLRT